jgi:hypothetical protein
MKKKALPIGTIFIILVITLALLGVGYALWSETLTITGNVETGEVDVGIIADPAVDVVECVDVNGVLTCPEPAAKADAANCTLEKNYSTDPDDNGVSELVVNVDGMYPSYHCMVSFTVKSLGNVPVHVWLPEASGEIPEWVVTDFDECYENGFQLHQGEETGTCTIDIHFSNEQAPEENSGPYTFSWTILATQWNEDPAEVITVPSSLFNFNSAGGWAGWSCPVDHPYVVSATNDCTDPLAVFQPAKPGVAPYPVYPHYTYTPPEQGWVIQNNSIDAQSCRIYVDCSNVPVP